MLSRITRRSSTKMELVERCLPTDHSIVKLNLKRITFSLYVLAMIGALSWLIHSASKSETGMEILRQHGRDATLGWFVAERKSIAEELPSSQADQLLEKAKRVLAESGDADVVMGAAFLLDSPNDGFQASLLKRGSSLSNSSFDELLAFYDAMNAAEDRFEEKCGEECLRLARRATELEPDNVEMWRARAILLWRSEKNSSELTLRTSDWQKVLELAKEHDPDNSLYDYLAARYLLGTSLDTRLEGNDILLIVKDQDSFELSLEHLEQAQAKTDFAFGTSGYSYAATFLKYTDIPITDWVKLVQGRQIRDRFFDFIFDLNHWTSSRVEDAETKGNPRQSIEILRNHFWLVRHLEENEPLFASEGIASGIGYNTLATALRIMQANQGQFTDEEFEETLALYESEYLQASIRKEAVRRLASNSSSNASSKTTDLPYLVGVVSGSAALLSPYLAPRVTGVLVLACFILLLSYFIPRNGTTSLRLHWVVLTFCLAFAFSFTLFGILPSHVLPEVWEAWLICSATLGASLAFVSWIAWRALRRGDIRFSMKLLFVIMLFVGVFFVINLLPRAPGSPSGPIPFATNMPTHDVPSIDGELLEEKLGQVGRFIWAVIQWDAYHGEVYVLVFWLLTLAGLIAYKCRARRADFANRKAIIIRFLGSWTQTAGKAFTGLAFLLFALYLASTTIELPAIENTFQRDIAMARNPDAYWGKFYLAMKHVKQDETTMVQLRSEAKTAAIEEKNRSKNQAPF